MAPGHTDFVPKETDSLLIAEAIGTGSYSQVYRAVEKGTNNVLAIKSYKMKDKGPLEVARAACEVAMLKILKHPHIIEFRLYDITEQYMFLGVEFSNFGPLNAVCKNPTEKVVQAIMKQTFSALQYLHDLSIIHGDVKPENIVVMQMEPSILVKLIDFGVAEIYDPEKRGTRLGSFLYMAPELHFGFPYDKSVDLYASGIMMFELLFNSRPFSLSIEGHLKSLRKRKPIIYPSDRVKELSIECMHLLKWLLEYDKSLRPSTDQVLVHPFINVGKQTYPKQDHYNLGCECLLRSFEMVRMEKYGFGCVEATEGVLRLKIYAMSVLPDKKLHDYLYFKIQDYSNYLTQLENRVKFNKKVFIKPPPVCDMMRCILSPTPALLDAYEICVVGEMYLNQNNIEQGTDKLRKGLEMLLFHLRPEPHGERRILVTRKIDQWVKRLENLSANDTGTKS